MLLTLIHDVIAIEKQFNFTVKNLIAISLIVHAKKNWKLKKVIEEMTRVWNA